MALLYPYDQTVFPRGLTGPVIQWNGGNAGDIYYVRAVSPTFTFEGYSHAPSPSRFEFPKEPVDIWKKLTDSTTGDVILTVQRYDGATAYLPRTETWTIANANLTGFIYYWEVNTGNVVRIAPGATMPLDRLPLAQHVRNSAELAQLNPGGGAPAHPVWAGDATKVAFSVRTDGNGLDFNTSTLWVTDVDLMANTFSNTKMIVANDPARWCVTFPTFSADSKWIAFERSTQARSRGAGYCADSEPQ
jgi:Tol biopolymer transport system component